MLRCQFGKSEGLCGSVDRADFREDQKALSARYMSKTHLVNASDRIRDEASCRGVAE